MPTIAMDVHRRTSPLTAGIVAGAMLAAFAGSMSGSSRLVPLLTSPRKADVYFDADAPRVYENVTSRQSNHTRNKLHPLASLPGWLAVRALGEVVDDGTAARTMVALNAAASIGTFLWVLAVVGVSGLDLALMAILALSTATAWFWFTMVEIFPFGTPGLLLSVGLVAGTRPVERAGWYILAQLATLGATVSNWPASLAATFLARPLRNAVRLSVIAIAVTLAVQILERPLFPNQRFPLRQEARFLRPVTADSVWQALRVFFVTSVVAPAIHEEPDTTSPAKRLSTVRSPIGSAGIGGLVASVAWIGALLIGLSGLAGLEERRAFVATLGVALVSQCALHLVYGRETFLYAAHYVPLLLVVAACGLLTRAAPVARVLIAIVVALAIPANVEQMASVLAYLRK